MFIYLIVNHETGKYYIGQHKGKSLKKYLQTKLSNARYQENGRSRLFNSMRKYPQSTLWSIHALRSDIQTREELDQTEKDFIKFLKSQDPEYGYNICRGGEGFTGPHTEETRIKISIASRNYWQIPGMRKHRGFLQRGKPKPSVGEKLRGRKRPPEFGAQVAIKLRGQIRTEEQCNRMSVAHKNIPQLAEQMAILRRKKQMGVSSETRDKLCQAQMLRRIREGCKPRRTGFPKSLGLSVSHKAAISQALKGLVCDEKRKNSLNRGKHTRWHVSRGIINTNCRFCQEGLPKSK